MASLAADDLRCSTTSARRRHGGRLRRPDGCGSGAVLRPQRRTPGVMGHPGRKRDPELRLVSAREPICLKAWFVRFVTGS